MVPAYLIFLHVVAACWGATTVAADGFNWRLEFAFPMVMAFAAVLTCAADARRRGLFLPHMAQFLMLSIWPLAGPLYVIWSRGIRGLGWALLWPITIGLTMTAGAAGMALIRVMAEA